jgi:2,5-dihydroxypyridine 5,6-dioxygenase
MLNPRGSFVTGTLEYLRKPLAANIAVGDQVLVLTDTEHDPRVWQAVLTILTDLGAEATLALFDPRPADYFDPPRAVAEAMKKVAFNILLTTRSLLHSPAASEAMALGIPSICMDGGMTLEMFQSGAVTEDPAAMSVIRHHVAQNVFGEDADVCRVITAYGTDLTYSVRGRIFVPPLKPEGFDHWKILDMAKTENRSKSVLVRYLHPTGEFNVPPVEYSANGVLVIDLTMHRLGRLTEPVSLTIRDGVITDIDGGAEAYSLRKYLRDYGDENAYCCPAEASVGINRKALVRGLHREDKNIFGSMHFGIGTNVDVGGTIRSAIHIDGVVLQPTLYVDGEKKIENGEFLVPVGVEDATRA